MNSIPMNAKRAKRDAAVFCRENKCLIPFKIFILNTSILPTFTILDLSLNQIIKVYDCLNFKSLPLFVFYL